MELSFNSKKFYRYDVEDWKTKKEQFNQYLTKTKYVSNKSELSTFDSDKNTGSNYLQAFINIFDNELQSFGKEIGARDFEIQDIWSVRYMKGDWHTPHTHGNCNWSACLYFDLDETVTPIENLGTHFITERVNNVTNKTTIESPTAKEGMMLIFPANILHFTLPNKSDKPRVIVGFDIITNGKQ